MKREEVKKHIEALRKEINHHRYLYHVLDREEISESALDSLKKELFDLEGKFPDFVSPDSPTQRVGGKPLEKFKKIRHSVPMLSFNDAFSEKDIEAWEERILKLLSKREKPSYYTELKIDGLAVAFEYRNGVFIRGSTRGDGLIGEDVTRNLKTVEAIPLRLLEKDHAIRNLQSLRKELVPAFRKTYEGHLEVRGEVFITKKEFGRINREQEKRGFSPYANPRNIAAGSVRQLDPKITASRRLDSFSYSLKTDLGQKTHEDEHLILKALGFKTNSHTRHCNSLTEVFEYHERWEKMRETLQYEIDGIVVLVNENIFFRKLGVVGKAPRGVIAYKFAGREGTTIIEDIKVQVGRTGSLTPVAYLKPVKVGGVTISRASLHNKDEIRRLGIKIGDTAIVRRAGDVIPDVVRVLPGLRTGKERNFHMPKKCPACGARVTRPKGEVAYYCTNKRCFARSHNWMKYFVSRNAFNIEGLGRKIIEQLMNEGLVSDPADLFMLREGDLVPLERFAEKSASNLVGAIENAKTIPFSRFIYALGISHVGGETAYDLASRFRNIKELRGASVSDLKRVKDIGEIVAESIYTWFHDPINIKFLGKLEDAGVRIMNNEHKRKPSKFTGQTFVFTGELKRFTREEAEGKVRELGGDVSSSVSRQTNYVVAGENPGSKYETAKKLGVEIITEKEFLKMIN